MPYESFISKLLRMAFTLFHNLLVLTILMNHIAYHDFIAY